MMIAYAGIKMSIVAFYRRLFVVHARSAFDIITLITQVVIFLWAFTFILLIIFPCGLQIWANWGSTAAQLQYCPVAFTSEYGLTISDLILDIYIFMLPLPPVCLEAIRHVNKLTQDNQLWGLQLATKKKFAISGVLLLGAMYDARSPTMKCLLISASGLLERRLHVWSCTFRV